MRPSQIESWVLDIVDRVQSGAFIEDARVELKATWIEPERAARRIAGHANAAHGTPVLWLIGIDEKYGVVGVDTSRFLSWHHQLVACFDGVAPAVTDLAVPVNGSSLLALLFETNRAPYVVQNPVFGSQGGGPVQWEIPWREGTSIRSAGRREVLKLLSPLQNQPNLERLGGRLEADDAVGDGQHLAWKLTLSLYNAALGGDRVVIPFHKCKGVFEIDDHLPLLSFDVLHIHAPYRESRTNPGVRAPLSLTIQGTPDEVFITGPGKMILEASAETVFFPGLSSAPVGVTIHLLPIDADFPISLDLAFKPFASDAENAYVWVLDQ